MTRLRNYLMDLIRRIMGHVDDVRRGVPKHFVLEDDDSKVSEYAHKMATLKLRRALGKMTERGYYIARGRLKNAYKASEANGGVGLVKRLDAERYSEDFVANVMEAVYEYDDPQVELNARINLKPWGLPTATVDVLILAPPHLHLIEFTFANDVLDDAVANPRLMLLGEAALCMTDLGDIKTLSISTFQPRLYNNSTWRLPVSSLMISSPKHTIYPQFMHKSAKKSAKSGCVVTKCGKMDM